MFYYWLKLVFGGVIKQLHYDTNILNSSESVGVGIQAE